MADREDRTAAGHTPHGHSSHVDLLDLRWIARCLLRHIKLVATIVVTATSLLTIYYVARGTRYEAIATVVVGEEQPEVVGSDPGTKRGGRPKSEMMTQARIAQSDAVLTRAARMIADQNEDLDAEDVRPALSASISVELVRDTRILVVSAKARSGADAARRATAVANAIVDHAADERRAIVRESFGGLAEEVASQKARTEESERKLLEYEADNNIVSLTRQIIEQRIVDANAQLRDVVTLRHALEATLSEIERALSSGDRIDTISTPGADSAPGGRDSAATDLPAISDIRDANSRRRELEQELSAASVKLRDKHPDIVSLKRQIEVLEQTVQETAGRLASQLSSQIRIKNSTEMKLIEELATAKKELEQYSRKTIEHHALESDVQGNRAIYETLLQRLKEVDIGGNINGNHIRVVDTAPVPKRTDLYKLLRNLILMAAVSFAFASTIAIIIEITDAGIHEADIRAMSSGHVLGRVPWLDDPFDVIDPPPPLNNAFRDIRTALQFQMKNTPMKTLVVSSSVEGEGKSTSAFCLARAFAEIGLSVLVIDADTYKAELTRWVDASDKPGLREFVGGEASLVDIAYPTRIDNVRLLPCSPSQADPGIIVGSDAMKDLIERAASLYDLVLIDTPPMAATLEVAAVASMADGAVLLTRIAHAPRAAVERALEGFDRANANLLGILLMGFDREAGLLAGYGYTRYGDYGQYYQSYGYGADKKS